MLRAYRRGSASYVLHPRKPKVPAGELRTRRLSTSESEPKTPLHRHADARNTTHDAIDRLAVLSRDQLKATIMCMRWRRWSCSWWWRRPHLCSNFRRPKRNHQKYNFDCQKSLDFVWCPACVNEQPHMQGERITIGSIRARAAALNRSAKSSPRRGYDAMRALALPVRSFPPTGGQGTRARSSFRQGRRCRNHTRCARVAFCVLVRWVMHTCV
jgi:hypothetical protein